MKNALLKRIEKLESQGYVYHRDYLTGTHILKQALVKYDGEKKIIKSVENGKIVKYN